MCKGMSCSLKDHMPQNLGPQRVIDIRLNDVQLIGNPLF